MNWLPKQPGRYALALAAGLLLAAAFPKIGLVGGAWLAPGLMLAAALGTRGWLAFRLGFTAGVAHFLASLYWLLHIPVPVAPIVGWLALSAFLALFAGGWVWACWTIFPARTEPPTESPAAVALPLAAPPPGRGFAGVWRALDDFLATTWVQRFGWALACAALWVAWEMVQARIFSGFPWNLLGASQYELLPLIQIAQFTGVYGVSFLAVWFSVALLGALGVIFRQPTKRSGALMEVAVPLLAAVFTMVWGSRQLFARPAPGPEVKVALVQPSIPQTTIWDSRQTANRFRQLVELSEQALQNKPDLLVWPEAAVPSLFRYDTNRLHEGKTMFETVTGLAKRHGVWIILGADDAEPRADRPGEADFFNSSWLVNPAGEVVANYRKQRLVIFGEYVPLSQWLPFLKDFTQVHGEFTAGKEPVPFVLPALELKTSVLICFEDVFPHHARKHVEPDTDFLLNLTNNGWFGESAAQWQHAAAAVFRAVENGLPLVRCSNNGLTCWVDAQGRMYDVFFPDSSDVYQAGFKIVEVPLLGGATREPTFYQARGDWFGWGCVGLGVLTVLRRLVQGRARRRQDAGADKLEPSRRNGAD